MSIIQVANIHFTSLGTSRFDQPTANTVRLMVNSANVAFLDTSGVTVNGNLSVSQELIATDITVSGDIVRNGQVVYNVPAGGIPNQVLTKNSTSNGDSVWANTGSPVLIAVDCAGANTPAYNVSGYSSLLIDFASVGNGTAATAGIHLSSDGGVNYGVHHIFMAAPAVTARIDGVCIITGIANTENKAINVYGFTTRVTGNGNQANTTLTESTITSPLTHVKLRPGGYGGVKFKLYGIR